MVIYFYFKFMNFFTHLPIWLLNFTEGEGFPVEHSCISVWAFWQCSALQSNSQPLSGSWFPNRLKSFCSVSSTVLGILGNNRSVLECLKSHLFSQILLTADCLLATGYDEHNLRCQTKQSTKTGLTRQRI